MTRLDISEDPLSVIRITSSEAAELVVKNHYLHRRPPISFSFGLIRSGITVGVCTFGSPASRHLQIGVCPSDPSLVIELNRLWVQDEEPRNTESWFVSRALSMIPPRIVVSYADTGRGHQGFIYRALSWHYSGWTDMERKTPRFDYIPIKDGAHTREASRSGYSDRVRRVPKIKYWTTTGSPSDRRRLTKLCAWPSLDWNTIPPPVPADCNSALRADNDAKP